MRQAVLIFAGFVGALIGIGGQAQSAVISYEIKDIGGFADYATPDVGQSYAGTGFVGMYETTFAHLFGIETSNFSRTVLQADISALIGKTINSATLTFELVHGTAGAQTVTATSFTADGGLEHNWTPLDNLGSINFSVDGLSSNSLDVTSLLQSSVAANANWFGLHLQGSSLYHWTYTHTGSGYSVDQAQVRLVVDYSDPIVAPVPEPASLAVWGIGSLGMAYCAARRRRKQQAT